MISTIIYGKMCFNAFVYLFRFNILYRVRNMHQIHYFSHVPFEVWFPRIDVGRGTPKYFDEMRNGGIKLRAYI